MNLAAWVLVGGAAGILVGLLFGDDCAILSPIGFAYVGLLQAAVYPYLICSLLHGLGSLEPGKAWRLFKCGWLFYVAAWIVTFATLAALARAIPEVNPAVIAETAGTPHSVSSLLGLLIPTDLFTALTQNYVPAVVIFCNWIVRLAPVGVFALFAVTAGTTALHDLVNMGLYLTLFMIGAGILSFWILPGLITGLAPVGHREVIRELQGALAIAAVTTLSVAALPFVTEATRRIADRCGIGEPERDDIIRTNLSVAYPLGQLGNFFVYLFLVFAAYYFKAPLEGRNEALLPLMTLLSGFGSPTSAVNAVAFLSDWLPLPRGTPELYVELQTITRYGQVIASVMAFAFLSVLVTLAYYGKLRLRPGRLVASILLPGLVLGALAWTGHQIHRRLAPVATPYGAFTLDPAATRGVQTAIYRSAADYARSRDAVGGAFASASNMSRIQQTGILRVGYNASVIPFCYVNDRGELVGFDVAYAYDLARSLNVRLVFVPFEWPDLEADLVAGKFDIAMAGIYATTRRLSVLSASSSYYQSPLALFMPSDRAARFMTRGQILAMPNLRIGVFDDPVLRPALARLFPRAEIVVVPDYTTLPDFTKIDAAIWTLEQAGAIARSHPGIIAVVPKDVSNPFLLTYLMPPHSDEMVHFVSYWLDLRKADGMHTRELKYWLLGQPRTQATPRWSVVRDVLHWKL